MRSTRLLPCVALSFAGCFPAVSVEQPAIIGRVVDPSGRPTSGTVVVVRAKGDGRVVGIAQTRSDGRFHQPAGDGHWILYFLPQDNSPPPVYGVKASLGGTSGWAADVTGGQVKLLGLGFTKTVDVGTVQMR